MSWSGRQGTVSPRRMTRRGTGSTALSTSRARRHLFSVDKVDEEGVWSDGPLWNDFGHRAALLGMIWSRVEDVLPFLVRTANSLSLTVFDWGGPSIYRPGSAPRPC